MFVGLIPEAVLNPDQISSGAMVAANDALSLPKPELVFVITGCTSIFSRC